MSPKNVIDGLMYDGAKVLAALSNAGFVVVPKEPTNEMIGAAIKIGFEGNEKHIVKDWRAMTAVAQSWQLERGSE